MRLERIPTGLGDLLMSHLSRTLDLWMEHEPVTSVGQRFAVRRMLWVRTSHSHSRRYRFASGVKFRLTNRWPSVFFLRITENQLQFTLDMKKIFVLSMLISFAMICSCQKQDTAAEQQLAQRKTELDAREKALDEREKALAERERTIVSARTIPPALQSGGQVRAPAQVKADPAHVKPDPAQVKAETARALQQLGPDAQMLRPDPARVQAMEDERNRRMQERLAQRQRKLEEIQRSRPGYGVNPGAAAFPGAAASPAAAASPEAAATSPSPSPTPQ